MNVNKKFNNLRLKNLYPLDDLCIDYNHTLECFEKRTWTDVFIVF
jgi:hypothetical protein